MLLRQYYDDIWPRDPEHLPLDLYWPFLPRKTLRNICTEKANQGKVTCCYQLGLRIQTSTQNSGTFSWILWRGPLLKQCILNGLKSTRLKAPFALFSLPSSGLLHPWEGEGNARLRDLRWIQVRIFGSYFKSPNSWNNMCPKRNLKAIPDWFWKLQHLLVDWFRSFHLSYLSVWRKVGNRGHIGRKGLSMCFHQRRNFSKKPTVNWYFQKFFTVFEKNANLRNRPYLLDIPCWELCD